MPVRVRIAPSPTGNLHIGTARTALFNYLFAKKNGGVFVMRIEDTDKGRSTKEFEENILESLSLLGLEWQEGPVIGDRGYKGKYGPYRQSERTHVYRSYIQKLLGENHAYYCFCTPQELEAQKQYYASLGKPWKYNGVCAKRSKKEQEELLSQNKPSIIRFRTKLKDVVVEDLIRGSLEFSTDVLEDFSIAKNENTPLYNLAVVIDDYEMGISHIIRGEDHIPNTPKQILLQEALGFPTPSYAHIPLILNPDRSKLSKRKGASSIEEYRAMGYLPEALINFIALLGWNPGTPQELFSLDELAKEFSIEHVHKSGAIFNTQKLDSINSLYIRKKSKEEFASLCIPHLISQDLLVPEFSSGNYPPAYGGVDINQSFALQNGKAISFERISNIVSLYQERIKRLGEIADHVDFFFLPRIEYSQELLSWKGAKKEDTISSLEESLRLLSDVPQEKFTNEFLNPLLLQEAERFADKIDKGKDKGCLLWPLRVALTGKKASAPPAEILSVFGKEEGIARIQESLHFLTHSHVA
jgi:glutamyl-tRNA synthetase